MELLPQSILDQLAVNGRANQERIEAGEDTIDHHPVVKLFTPDAGATWLLSETDPEDPDIAHGLCDLGLGFPEIGSVRLSAFEALTSGEHDKFAPFFCFLDGATAVVIVAVMSPEVQGGKYHITPLFVGVTEGMVLTDHDGAIA